MRLLATCLLALVTALAAAAAERDSVGITFVNSGGLHSVASDGTGLSLLRANGCPVNSPPPCPVAHGMSWAPDGSRLAFVFGSRIYLFDMRDGTQKVLSTGVDVDHESRPAWSPDGHELAFASVNVADDGGEGLASGSSSRAETSRSDLYLINVENGTVRRLTSGRQTTDPAWAPGPQIAYSSFIQGRWELLVIAPDGSHRQLTDGGAGVNRRASWSPDGTEIAFLRDASGLQARLNAIRPDGSGLRQLSNLPIVDHVRGDQPAWSPDGSLIAVSSSLNGRLDIITGNIPGRDLYVVAADGSGERRLTESAERGVADRGPTWSPDGSQLAFEGWDRDKASEVSLYTVNADGTCEKRIASLDGRKPDWRPGGSALPLRRCSDLVVLAKGPTARGATGRFAVTLTNDGTEPLTDIRLRGQTSAATFRLATSRNATCLVVPQRLSCQTARLGVGASIAVAVWVEARVLTRASGVFFGPRIEFSARTANAETSLSNNRSVNEVSLTSCRTGTPGTGQIKGTPRDDTICGRSGNDRIVGLEGNDRIAAGVGDDVITAGPGKDTVSCGAGLDRVTSDGADRVARDCERVLRR